MLTFSMHTLTHTHATSIHANYAHWPCSCPATTWKTLCLPMQHFSIVHRQTNKHPSIHPSTHKTTNPTRSCFACTRYACIYTCAHNFKSLCVGLCRRALRTHDYISYLRVTEDYDAEVTYMKNCCETKWWTFIEVSKRCSSFLTKHFKVKRHFNFEACISLVPVISSV